MNLFERLVDEALRSAPDLAPVRSVVAKELLHHDILREMSASGLLSHLTFVGGTCLRACYGSPQLSEDLDFAGGTNFERRSFSALGGVLVERLKAKYSLEVTVTEPVRESDGVATWKMSMITQPHRRNLPSQRIHIDICAVPSHDRRPMMLRNVYGVDMDTSGLILQAQSREEILADKIVALAFRPNRLKNRDLWDVAWLRQRGVELPAALIPRKISDHRQTSSDFITRLTERVAGIRSDPAARKAFVAEMQRFIPARLGGETVGQDAFWTYLVDVVEEESRRAIAAAH